MFTAYTLDNPPRLLLLFLLLHVEARKYFKEMQVVTRPALHHIVCVKSPKACFSVY